MKSDFDSPLRLIVFDRTAHARFRPGLSTLWSLGRTLYRMRREVDAGCAANGWEQALAWLSTHGAPRPISEIQLWSHGKWGNASIGAECLDQRSLVRTSAHFSALEKVRARLAPGALFWFRTCETFGAERGITFAERFAETMGTRVAGHTYVIGLWQSGLHQLDPGAPADWSPEEGLIEGDAHNPLRAKPSLPGEPRTISCFDARLPDWASER
jgi:hypothetical protein